MEWVILTQLPANLLPHSRPRLPSLQEHRLEAASALPLIPLTCSGLHLANMTPVLPSTYPTFLQSLPQVSFSIQQQELK